MRNKLLSEIMNALSGSGIDEYRAKSKLVMILDRYEIEERCTEVAVVDENEIEKYIKMFLINKRVSGRTERTLKHYQATLYRFFEEVKKSPKDVTADDVKLYLATKEIRDNVSKVYQKNILRVISSFYTWMLREEHIAKNPMNKVDEIKIPKVKKEAFTEQDIEKIRMAANGNIRLICMIELLISTWCRVSELAQIKIKDIAEDRESVLIHGKGQKDRKCYINARCKIYLNKYLQERKDQSEWLFPGSAIGVNDKKRICTECKNRKIALYDWWKAPELVGKQHTDKCTIESMIRSTGKRAEVEKCHPHRFRRTGATFALRRGMPIEQVSKLLGHESIETTQIYLDISEIEIANAHRKYV